MVLSLELDILPGDSQISLRINISLEKYLTNFLEEKPKLGNKNQTNSN